MYAAAPEAHFISPVVQQLASKLAVVCSVDGFEVYGDPDQKVAAMAARFGAVINRCWM